VSPMVTLLINGASIKAEAGVTVASVLHQQRPALRVSPRLQAPRGLYCGMGVCFECAVTIDGQTQRACITQVRDGMVVEVAS
jgi:D-hydroxyproline dehydrogenase subunit gamma